ncbi:hypothetical protein D3C77_577070 [compost metagenome]
MWQLKHQGADLGDNTDADQAINERADLLPGRGSRLVPPANRGNIQLFAEHLFAQAALLTRHSGPVVHKPADGAVQLEDVRWLIGQRAPLRVIDLEGRHVPIPRPAGRRAVRAPSSAWPGGGLPQCRAG